MTHPVNDHPSAHGHRGPFKEVQSDGPPPPHCQTGHTSTSSLANSVTVVECVTVGCSFRPCLISSGVFVMLTVHYSVTVTFGTALCLSEHTHLGGTATGLDQKNTDHAISF